jgi:methylated-DNA-[protein]-cysteine S-methyltransferase
MDAMRLDQTATPITLEIPSSVGPLVLEAKAGRLTALRFDSRGVGDGGSTSELAAAAAQLEQYFAGRRRVFELPLELRAGTFDRRVLIAVDEIPHGERVTYGEVTAKLGLRPTKSARSPPRSGETRCRSWSRATGSSAPTVG